MNLGDGGSYEKNVVHCYCNTYSDAEYAYGIC